MIQKIIVLENEDHLPQLVTELLDNHRKLFRPLVMLNMRNRGLGDIPKVLMEGVDGVMVKSEFLYKHQLEAFVDGFYMFTNKLDFYIWDATRYMNEWIKKEDNQDFYRPYFRNYDRFKHNLIELTHQHWIMDVPPSNKLEDTRLVSWHLREERFLSTPYRRL